jgi:dUTP pyrophosphatase
MLPNTLYYKRLDVTAFHPRRATPRSAGLDLFSPVSCYIPRKGKVLIDIKLQIILPENTYGRIAPRSGLSSKHFIDVGAGVIDEDYQGSIKVLLFNFSSHTYRVKRGMAIAQLICEKVCIPDPVEHVGEIRSTTFRGDGGFGSSDVRLLQ